MFTEQFIQDVHLASKFDMFKAEFEPIFGAYQAGFAGGQSRVFDHNQLNTLLASVNVTMEDVTGAFQFEEWFFTHFVEVKGEAQEPAVKWH